MSVCGLFWTLILSLRAGSAKDYGDSSKLDDEAVMEEEYCVTGMENECLIGKNNDKKTQIVLEVHFIGEKKQ